MMSIQRNYLQTVIFDLKKSSLRHQFIISLTIIENSLADHFFQCVLRDRQRFILLDHR